MTLTSKIRNQIEQFSFGQTFGYKDLNIDKQEFQAAAKALERLQKDGLIKKVSKGIFYKPEQTIFGELKPDKNEQLKPYLFKNNQRIAYETGISLYNRMGLTTQMAFTIQIASRSKRIKLNRNGLKAEAVKSYVEVNDENYQYLGILDAIKDIKRIPDYSTSQILRILIGQFNMIEVVDLQKLITYAMYYPPRVRALLGAIIENQSPTIDLSQLKDSLNPLTKVNLRINGNDLPTIKNWNIQ
jgi:hypothetical protein